MGRPGWRAFAFAQACVLPFTAVIAYLTMFSTYVWFYDDEGFMMMTVRHVLDGHRLYDEAWNPYGPVYYLYEWILHGALGLPLTHNVVRLNAVAVWLAIALLAATVVFGMTRSLALAVIGQVLVTFHLGTIANEPGHPQELGTLMAATLVAIALGAGDRQRPLGIVALGLLAGMLAMVKVNLGAFAGIAVWMALLATLPRRGAVGVLGAASTVVVIALPWALTRGGFDRGWASLAAALVSAVVGIVLLTLRRSGQEGRQQSLASFAAACVAGVALGLVFPLTRQTSLAALVDALVVLPVRFAGTSDFAANFSGVGPAALAASVALAALCAWLGPVRLTRRDVAPAVAAAKLAFALYALVVAWSQPFELLLCGVTPFVWVLLLPAPDDLARGVDRFPRLVLVWLAALWPLQVYPVAGSQRFFGTFLLLPCALVAGGDALAWARSLVPAPARPPLRAAAAALMLAVMASLGWGRLATLRAQYARLTPLGLPGASRLRMGRLEAETLRKLVKNLRVRSDTFLAYPGFDSLYFWAGKTPPTLDVLPHDVRLLPEARQEAMVSSLLKYQRPYVVRFHGLLPPYPPFVERIDRYFQPTAHVGGFTLLARRREGVS